MKLLVILSLIACGYAAKLDRTYLPPSSAATAGGSPGFLNAPAGPSGSTGFGQLSENSGFGQPAGFDSSNSPGFGKPTSGAAFGVQPSASTGFAPSATYGQPGSPAGTLDPGFSQVAQNFGPGAEYQRNQPQRAQASADQAAEILRLDNQNDGETFSYSFETSNGITAEESGVATNGVQAQGAFSYSDDDGQNFRVTYTADENGYQPQGDHLPTPHPIPEEILKSIEQNAQAAASGTQEGAYNPNEDNNGLGPQQYDNNAPTSYSQIPSGSGSIYQPQGSGPSQLYSTPNAGDTVGSRLQSRGQTFQPQGPPQQYGAPIGGVSPAKPSNGFGQAQTIAPSQVYESLSNSGALGANAASQAMPNSFGQNQFQSQGPSQQYSAPSRPGAPGGFNGFSPSGPASQPKPSQYQASSQSGFPSAGRSQAPAQGGQAQGDSGYNYNRPQGSTFGQGPNGQNQTPAGQNRPQGGSAQSSGPQGSFPRPNSNNAGYPSGPAQGSFGSSSGPKGPSSFGPSAGPAIQGSFGLSGPKGPSSFGPSSGSNGRTSLGSSSGANGFGRLQDSFPALGTKGAMPESGYTYNRPGSQSGVGSQQPQGFSNAPGSGPGQIFGGPRQPPSFSEEEGYKY